MAEGGLGGGTGLSGTRDVHLAARALAEGWDVPPDARRAMLDRLGAVVADPATKLRAFLAAARALTPLSAHNLRVVDTAIRAEQHEELRQRLCDLEARIGAGDRG